VAKSRSTVTQLSSTGGVDHPVKTERSTTSPRCWPSWSNRLMPRNLLAAAQLCPTSWVQRLGYLLDSAEHRNLAECLVPFVSERARFFAPLVRAKPRAGAERLKRWKLAVNATADSDA
jgi:hypothetical protein